ncbi:MAG: hypothetical protein WAT39_12285 [Planctomycetota bacterium]
MTFLLDTNVVSYFFQARRHDELARAARSQPCALADAVVTELTADRARGALFSRWLPSSSLIEIRLLVGSAADEVLLALETGLSTRRGNGERTSIALAATDPSMVFVASDKGALWIALRELHAPGERAIGLQVFLRRLVDTSALEGIAAEDVLTASQQVKPTWWARWRRGDQPR